MAALDDLSQHAQGQMTAGGISITPSVWNDLKPFIGAFFWKWYEEHKDLIMLRTGFWFIHFTIRVQDLDNLFALLFGDEPQQAP